MPVGAFDHRIKGEINKGLGDGEWMVLSATLSFVDDVESLHA